MIGQDKRRVDLCGARTIGENSARGQRGGGVFTAGASGAVGVVLQA